MAYAFVFTLTIFLFSTVQLFGQQTYNPVTSICCNGTIDDKEDNTVCCGSIPFDYKKFVCCNNAILPIPTENGTNYACCFNSKGEAKVTNMDTQQCCDGKPIDKPLRDAWYGCCNGQLYNESTHLCCDKKIFDRLLDQQCCVDRVFNASIETCCQEWGRAANDSWIPVYHEVFPHDGNRTLCCGRGLYDPNTESCCENQIKPKPKDMAADRRASCCTDEPYDAAKQRCCITGDMINGKYTVTGHKIHINQGIHNGCCALELFDPKKEACCNATVMPKPDGMDEELWGTCCGDQVHDFKTHLCHNDKLVKRNSSDIHILLCGDSWYNATSQKCCGDEVLELDSDVDCCWRINKKYIKSEQACCDDEVIPLTEEDKLEGRSHCCVPIRPHLLANTD